MTTAYSYSAQSARQGAVIRERAQLAPFREVHSLIREVGDPHISLEPAFREYVQRWVYYPTLDATSHGLHCLREVGTLLEDWLPRHRDRHRVFLSRCLRRRGFAIAPHETTASLYATVNALNILKALVGVEESVPLIGRDDQGCEDAVRALIGDSVFDDVVERSLGLVKACVSDEGVVDNPVDARPSANSLYFAISLLWNLGWLDRADDFGCGEKDAAEFVLRCQEPLDGEFLGFVAEPCRRASGRGAKPCSTTSAMALLGFARAGWDFPVEQSRVFAFLREMQDPEVGGFRVFPGEPVTLSATSFSVMALSKLDQLNGEREAIAGFVEECHLTDSGFGFAPGLEANANCTRYGLRTYRHMCIDEGEQLRKLREDVTRFVSNLFDRELGGFWGYHIAADELPAEDMGVRSVAVVDSPLAVEARAFANALGDLIRRHPGQYALVVGDQLEVFESKRSAIEAGYRKCGLDPFLVERIEKPGTPLRLSGLL